MQLASFRINNTVSAMFPAVKEGSIQKFSAQLEKLLPVKFDPGRSRARPSDMQSALTTLQALMKAFCAEVMQLLLQVGATVTTDVCHHNIPHSCTAACLSQSQLTHVGSD